jgi:L-alanine-DL-glutamate epimerase-like enolase superfamily enzyme
MRRLTVRSEVWPIVGEFRIARGSKTEAHVIVVEIEDNGVVGRGECVPYRRYGETVEDSMFIIEALRPKIEQGLGPSGLQSLITASAARNAIDCALWDLTAKLMGIPVWRMLDLPEPKSVITAYTLSLASPEDMAQLAASKSDRPVLKMKLAGDADDVIRLRAVRAVRPDAKLLVDGNEGFERKALEALMPELIAARVELIEQPIRSGSDATLETVRSGVTLCADESIHTRIDLNEVKRRYSAINVKLDKAGGLSEAAALVKAAKAMEMPVMIGCMVATSLAMAPAMMLSGLADWIDLDGPQLLVKDREPGLVYNGSVVSPPTPALWG